MDGVLLRNNLFQVSFQTTAVISAKPHSFGDLYTKQHCRYSIFFSLISEGEDEVKKVQFFN